MYDDKYNVSFRCFYGDPIPHYNTHYAPAFSIADIPRWIDSYKFTHPNCESVSCKIWFVDKGAQGDEDCDTYD